jgi:hypothetical protein
MVSQKERIVLKLNSFQVFPANGKKGAACLSLNWSPLNVTGVT